MLTTADLGRDHPGWPFLTGRTPLFAAQADQRFSYCLYVPSSYRTDDPTQPLVVAVHGTRRGAESFRDELSDLAERTGCLILAPLFPAGIGDPNDLDAYKFVERAGVRYDAVLLAMIDEVGHRWRIDVRRFHLCGFSGGGQFAHRCFYLHPRRMASVAIGAPGRATLFDDTTPWPDGVADLSERFGIAPDAAAMAPVPVLVFVGGDDVAPRTGVSGGAVPRTVRAAALAASIEAAGCRVELAVVPGAAHDRSKMLGALTTFLTAQLDREKSLRDLP